jgi:predicted transposase YdaD
VAPAADLGSKRLIGLAPDAWVRWVTQRPSVSAGEVLASDFQWVGRQSDVLVKAQDPEIGQFLVLTELQFRYSSDLPRRMRAYAALAEERYHLPAYPVLVNLLPASEGTAVVGRWEATCLGLQSRQDFRVLNLWEIDSGLVFHQPLPFLVPFVPIMKGGDNESVVRRALAELRGDERLRDMESLLAFFASFVLDSELVQRIMRWDMVVLHESPWYREILDEGIRQGRFLEQQEGRHGAVQPEAVQQYVRQGMRQGLMAGIELGLELKFGSEGLRLLPEIMKIDDSDVLMAISEGIKIAHSTDELRKIYEA